MEIKLPDISCTGCGSCLKACKSGAISMQEQNDGFLYPVINSDKCVECRQCIRSCHALCTKDFNEPFICFAAQVKHKDVLYNSTSGGVFYVLAVNIIGNGGVVYGCAFDKAYNAVISRAESLNQINPMHGSKYVWSDSSQSYPMVKTDLESGRTVLYTCLPCQGAGLKRYLGKDYSNLFIVDILCGGAPSPYAFQEYLKTIDRNDNKQELHFKFRDKERFGAGVNCTYTLNKEKHFENWLENSFYFAFSSRSRITWRRSCYDCDYKSIKRISDLTIGDYWGVEKYHTGYDPKEGVSVILVNTDRGALLFESVKGTLHYEKSDVSFVMEKNSLVKEISDGHVQVPLNRDAFFQTIREKGWKEADKKYLKLRKKLLHKQRLASLRNKIIVYLIKK